MYKENFTMVFTLQRYRQTAEEDRDRSILDCNLLPLPILSITF